MLYNKQYDLHSTLPGTMDTNITLGLDPITLSSPQRIARLLNVTFLPGSFSKTFIDTMFFSLLSYVFTFLFNMYRLPLYFITFNKL